MVTASAGVQTDLSKVVHSSSRSICQSSEPQTSTVRISSPRPKCLGHRCSKLKLDGSHCLCLTSDGSLSQDDQKNQAMSLPDHRNSSGNSSQQRSHCNFRCQRLFSNSPTIMCSTAIHNISTSTPGV